LRAAKADESIRSTLSWALNRMKDKGYTIHSKVVLSVDPDLTIMGFARKEGNGHAIVISEWALDSEMLGGLVLHELAHIYFTEQGAHSHDSEIIEEVLEDMRDNEGLRARETQYLIDSFNHLQNILVDDVVFDVMGDREREMTRKFFSEWVSEKPTGDPVHDAAALCRNAFAIASLRRRGLLEEGSDMVFRNREFAAAVGEHAIAEFDWMEAFLEKASPRWDEKEYRRAIREYFDRVLALMRSSARMGDLR
jgi:hypothetical protein